MIKKLSVLFLFSFLFASVSYADVQRNVKLSDDKHPKEHIETTNYNIFLELTNVSDNGIASIKVELENLSESKGLSLFCMPYSEKILKKKPFQYKYDKKFPGIKGKRTVDDCGIIDEDFRLDPQQKKVIKTLSVKDGEPIKITIPIYTVEYKEKNLVLVKKKGMILKQKEVIELNLEIDLKPGEEYYTVVKECDSLVKEFEGAFFCNNKKHKPSLEEQKHELQSKIDTLISKIDEIIDANGWFSSDKRYKMFDEQRNRLKDIDLKDKEGDCGKHVDDVVVHKCKYCRSSLQQIYHKLDDIYQNIYSSIDRNASKLEHIKEVKLMYNCARNRKDWKRSDYNAKIVRLYNAINQF